MNHYCRLGLHRPGASMICNQGRRFNVCADCGESLVARRTGWSAAPRGQRIVWIRRQPGDVFAYLSPNPDRRRVKPRLIASILRPFRRRSS